MAPTMSAQAIVSAGWAALLVVLARIVAVGYAGAGWWLLFPREQRPSLWTCVLLRYVREGANALLPLAQIGGDFIGARCLALRGFRGARRRRQRHRRRADAGDRPSWCSR